MRGGGFRHIHPRGGKFDHIRPKERKSVRVYLNRRVLIQDRIHTNIDLSKQNLGSDLH
jgi:hypothetical protein